MLRDMFKDEAQKRPYRQYVTRFLHFLTLYMEVQQEEQRPPCCLHLALEGPDLAAKDMSGRTSVKENSHLRLLI